MVNGTMQFDQRIMSNCKVNLLTLPYYKKPTGPDGCKDKNVFDIKKGVAIAFFIKRRSKHKADAVVRHADLWGLRESKYDWLDGHDLKNTDWQELKPTSPFHLFVRRDNTLEARYRCFVSISDLFLVNSVGIVTARDGLTIHWSAEEAWKAVNVFSSMEPELARQGYQLGKDAQDWKVSLAQKDLIDSGPTRDKIAPILYRPFDVRHTYYTGRSRGFICRPRPEVMRHMLAGENLALITPKQHKDEFGAMAVQTIGAHKSVAAGDINYYFPLYLYPTADRSDLFAHLEPSERQPNLNPTLVSALAETHGKKSAPEEIFHYVYAVLYASTYRTKYAEFLRTDFPRIPFTADPKLFQKLALLGARLTALHLLTSPELDPPACRFEGEGDSRISKGRKAGFRYEPGEQRVYINATQYFAPVPEGVWLYRVGGHQVCEKWLKERQERHLEVDDIRTYCRIVTALGRTLVIQSEIDALYPGIEKNVVAIPGGNTSKVDSGSPTIGSTRRQTNRA
jgi:predicted helicase